MAKRTWLERTLFPDGQEPDPRFTLANERTFLAWVRTALAFLAGGIALNAFDIPALSPRTQLIGSVVVVTTAVLIALGAAVRWWRIEQAMRRGEPLPVPAIIPVLILACIIGAIIVLFGIAR